MPFAAAETLARSNRRGRTRDGVQNEPRPVPAAVKLELIENLARAD